jgi:hypothetical protein
MTPPLTLPDMRVGIRRFRLAYGLGGNFTQAPHSMDDCMRCRMKKECNEEFRLEAVRLAKSDDVCFPARLQDSVGGSLSSMVRSDESSVTSWSRSLLAQVWILSHLSVI